MKFNKKIILVLFYIIFKMLVIYLQHKSNKKIELFIHIKILFKDLKIKLNKNFDFISVLFYILYFYFHLGITSLFN
jgi:hypothetical protein